MIALNKTKNSTIAPKTKIADTFLSRMIGLMNHKHLPSEEGLLITRCNSIHMFFMKFPIDVLFLDNNYQVVGVLKGIKPWRLSPIFFKACYALELAEGVIERSNSDLGDQIELVQE